MDNEQKNQKVKEENSKNKDLETNDNHLVVVNLWRLEPVRHNWEIFFPIFFIFIVVWDLRILIIVIKKPLFKNMLKYLVL